MSLLNTCDQPAAADVTLLVMMDECGCPGDLPVNPVKFATFDVGSRSINETRSEIEDPNAYGSICYKSTSDGAASSTPFTYSFCRNQKLFDGALGSKTKPGPLVSESDVDGIAPNILRSSSLDFWALGFRPGMVITVSGFNAQTAYNGKKIILSVSALGSSPSNITFYTNADIADYPAATANETDQVDITIDAGYITYQGNEAPNIIAERGFPLVTNESAGSGLYQVALGGVVESYSETYEWGQFATGSIDINYSVWDGSNTASLGDVGQEDACVCGDKVFLDPDDGRIVEMYFNGALVCFNTATFTLSRPVDKSKNSCGKKATPGKGNVTCTVEVPFTESTFLAAVRDKTTGPLLFVIWNEDRSQFTTRLFPDATVSSESIDPDDEAELTQEITFRGNNDPDVANSAIIGQRNFVAKMPPRNRIEFTTAVVTASDATREIDLVGGTIGETINIDWGDGTTATVVRDNATETLSRTYVTDGTYTVKIWSNGDAPWTDVVIDTATDVVTAPQLCYLREYLEDLTLVLGGTSLTLDNFPALESLTIVSSTLTSLLIPNCRLTTVDLSDATAMTVAGYDSVLSQLVASNVLDGTADLSGGSAVPSTAGAADVTILEGRGWTVTVNS